MHTSDFPTSVQRTAAWQGADKHFVAQVRTTASNQRAADQAAMEAKMFRLRMLRLAKEETSQQVAGVKNAR
jgi:uncharacterized membrane protein YadS